MSPEAVLYMILKKPPNTSGVENYWRSQLLPTPLHLATSRLPVVVQTCLSAIEVG